MLNMLTIITHNYYHSDLGSSFKIIKRSLYYSKSIYFVLFPRIPTLRVFKIVLCTQYIFHNC
jgi:hypothetical protein